MTRPPPDNIDPQRMPWSVRISLPRDMPRRLGVSSVSYDHGSTFTIRINKLELAWIEAAAKALGMSRNRFITWVATQAAKKAVEIADG